MTTQQHWKHWKWIPAALIALAFAIQAGLTAPAAASEQPAQANAPAGMPTRYLPGEWDGWRVRKPTVIQQGDSYMLWYDGVNFEREVSIGLATSEDGLVWTKSGQNPVLMGDPGEWDEFGEHAPFVLYREGQYEMWYEGNNAVYRQLGFATSPDGANWTKFPGNPVLQITHNSYDQHVAGHAAVLFEDPTYRMWYHAIGDQGSVIAYATSITPTTWTKHGPALLPTVGGWDESGIWGPSVLKDDTTYWMWYSGYGPDTLRSIGAATSIDGVTWAKIGTTPVITVTGSDISDPTVIKDGLTFKMWFTNVTEGQIYYAESTDGLEWSPPVLALARGFLHPLQGFHSGGEGAVSTNSCLTYGWVADPDNPALDVTVQVLVDGLLVEELTANEHRPGLDNTLCPGGTCGFSLDLAGWITEGTTHTITVMAYDVESQDWWGLETTNKTLTCSGYTTLLPLVINGP